MTGFPKGYRGVNHLTIGSDIMSLMEVLPIPEQILGKERAAELRQVKPNEWYPIKMLLEPLDLLAQKMGDRALVPIGFALVKLSHAEAIKKHFTSAKGLLNGFDAIYHRANRGEDIGGWKVLSFDPGKAVLENTTPHPCMLEVGIVQEALRVLQIPSIIKQTVCILEGADCCHFTVSSQVQDRLWQG